MAKEKGWIKVYRDIQNHWLWDEKPYDKARAWMDLLLTVNHENVKMLFNGNLIVIKSGQTITSIRKLADKWGWSRDKVCKFLSVLEEEKMIEKQSDSFRTLLTIVNYGIYQSSADSKKTAKRQAKDTNQDTNPAQTRMIKNDKEGKENTPAADVLADYLKMTEAEQEKWLEDHDRYQYTTKDGKVLLVTLEEQQRLKQEEGGMDV